jgi:Family of unknown function (DUF6011)
MSRWKWIWHGETKLYDVGILPDGTLHNPRGYPDDIVREAVAAADARQHERRSRAAQKAGATRRHRRQKRVAEIAARILAGYGIGERTSCAICGRGLGDPASMKRGIGSECWQDLLATLENMRSVA